MRCDRKVNEHTSKKDTACKRTKWVTNKIKVHLHRKLASSFHQMQTLAMWLAGWLAVFLIIIAWVVRKNLVGGILFNLYSIVFTENVLPHILYVDFSISSNTGDILCQTVFNESREWISLFVCLFIFWILVFLFLCTTLGVFPLIFHTVFKTGWTKCDCYCFYYLW